MKTTLTFNIFEKEQAQSLVWMIRELNESGVPYEIKQDGNRATLNIGEGY